MIQEERKCLYCQKMLFGRADKKYCDSHCKSAHQYKKSKENPLRFYNQVDNQLKRNRMILKEYNKGGKVTVRAELLIKQGFNPNFFTHYWKSRKGNLYLFVYEYGFLRRSENGRKKYVLVQWQDYMNECD